MKYLKTEPGKVCNSVSSSAVLPYALMHQPPLERGDRVDEEAEGEDVGSWFAASARDIRFRRSITRGPDAPARRFPTVAQAAEAEVRELHRPVAHVHQDVRRLQVPVTDPGLPALPPVPGIYFLCAEKSDRERKSGTSSFTSCTLVFLLPASDS